jgi:hypothetical protein
LIWKPDEATVSLTLVLTAFFIAEGAFQVGTSISYRDVLPGSWGSLLASGITDLVLAGLIICFWPQSASWTLGLIVGINLITTGLAILMAAIEVRNVGNPKSSFPRKRPLLVRPRDLHWRLPTSASARPPKTRRKEPPLSSRNARRSFMGGEFQAQAKPVTCHGKS